MLIGAQGGHQPAICGAYQRTFGHAARIGPALVSFLPAPFPGNRQWQGTSGGMTVRELVELLSECDPDSTVICDTRSEALIVVSVRGGMHQEWPAEPLFLSVEDKDFLCALRIRPDR